MATCTVTWSGTLQTMRGFGASSQQVLPQMTTAEADFLFSPSAGLGLSVIRAMISSYSQSTLAANAATGDSTISVTDISSWPQPSGYTGSGLPTPPYKMIVGTGGSLEVVKVTAVSGTTPATFTVTRAQNGTAAASHSSGANVTLPTSAEITSMQQAQARGALVYCLPWSPPGGWKSNGSNKNGGSLNAANYADMAWLLSLFVENMAGQGVTVSYLSVQNEPDISGNYETAAYSSAQYDSFLQTLGPKFATEHPGVALGLPEPSGWTFALADTALGDGAALPYMAFLPAHRYSGTIGYPTEASNHPNLQLWETEWTADLTQNGYDTSMNGGTGAGFTSGITVATEIHDMLTTAKCNGWLWWWLKNDVLQAGEDNEGLLSQQGLSATVAKRAYVVGQWAKFVRPGWVRLSETDSAAALYTAFRAADGTAFAIVCVNNTGSPVATTYTLSGFPAVASVVPWQTDGAGNSLTQQAAVAVSAGAFSYTSPADSVVTFSATVAPAPAFLGRCQP